MNQTPVKHKPVLVHEVIDYLAIKPGKTYVDVTFGAGGHTRAILQADPTVNVIAIDWDMDSIETYGHPLQEEFAGRLHIIWGNFAHLYKLLKKEQIGQIAGILADFGTSQMQIFQKAGFSFAKDSPLDMRMSPAHHLMTAAQILNTASKQELAHIFWHYGQERYAKPVAQAIVQQRGSRPFKTTGDLVALIERIIPRSPGLSIHRATRIFQALRIVVNKELDNMSAFLAGAMQVLTFQGRLVCISFHSLEDRLVKDFFNKQEQDGHAKVITRKVVVARSTEIKVNPSARSAKLRALERV